MSQLADLEFSPIFTPKSKFKKIILLPIASLVAVLGFTTYLATSSYKFKDTSKAALAANTPISYQSNSIIDTETDTPTIIKTSYTNPTGWTNLKEMLVWADVQTPRGQRLGYSLHAKLIKQPDGSYKLFGERFVPGSTLTCGLDAEVRHCYKNFLWDVGGLTPGATSGYLYINHDDILADTTARTPNSISSFRSLAVTPINSQTVQVTWEFTPGKYFIDRIMDVYTSGVNEVGNLYPETPAFRSNLRLQVFEKASSWYDPTKAPVQVNNFPMESQSDLAGWTLGGTDKLASITTSRNYLGYASIAISKNSNIQLDKQTPMTGVITASFYDDLVSTNSYYLSVSNAPETSWNLSTTHTILVGVNPAVSTTNYIYKARVQTVDGTNVSNSDNFRYFDTTVSRSKGWHRVRFWVTDQGSWAEIENTNTNIAFFNLTQLTITSDPVKGARIPYDREMTNFRYIRIGNWAATSNLNVDDISISTLPPLPIKNTADIATFAGALRMENYHAAIWLDMYEEMANWGNKERTNAVVVTGPTNVSWWWGVFSNLNTALNIRYRVTGLPFYLAKSQEITKFMLANSSSWANADWTGRMASGGNYLTMTGLTWNYLDDQTKTTLKNQYINFISNYGSNAGDGFVGDSHAEDTAQGGYPIVAAAFFFQDQPASTIDAWVNQMLTLTHKSISASRSEPCPTCAGGVTGVQNIYAPNTAVADCTTSTMNRPDSCLCKGDRATMPTNRDFSYVMDNHEYSPHPGYMSGAVDGITNAVYTAKIFASYGQPLPKNLTTDFNQYSPNLLPMWLKTQKYFNIAKGIYATSDIYKVRSAPACATGSSPYPASSNDFKVVGNDDWGNPATGITTSANYYLRAKTVFGSQVANFTDGAGNNINIDSQIDSATKFGFYLHMDYFTKQIPPNVYFSNWDAINIGNSASNVYTEDRLNGLNSRMYRIGLIDPSLKLPLTVGSGPTNAPIIPTAVPPTSIPPTSVPPSIVPPTAVPTVVPPTPTPSLSNPLTCASWVNVYVGNCNSNAKYSSSPKSPDCVTSASTAITNINVPYATEMQISTNVPNPMTDYCTSANVVWSNIWQPYATSAVVNLKTGDNKVCVKFRNAASTAVCGGLIFKI